MNYYATTNQLSKIDPVNSEIAFCNETKKMYRYETGTPYTADNVDVIAATSGQWIRIDNNETGHFAYSFQSIIPDYLLCDGSAVSRTTYAKLFSILSTTYGTGDGSTTFNLPDFRGLFLRGTGSNATLQDAAGNYFTGPAIGATQNDQMQGHEHKVTPISLWAEAIGPWSVVGTAGTVNRHRDHETNVTISDGTNGTPRTGSETRPANAGVYIHIRT